MGAQRKIPEPGEKFGLLTTINYARSNKSGHSMMTCVCVCGKIFICRYGDLKSNKTRSCGNTLCRSLLVDVAPRGNNIYRMMARARDRAKATGVPFNKRAFEGLKIPKYCSLLDIPLEIPTGSKKAVTNNNSVSVDQIIPGAGYVDGNIQAISFRANRIKSDATPEELLMIGSRMSAQAGRPVRITYLKPKTNIKPNDPQLPLDLEYGT